MTSFYFLISDIIAIILKVDNPELFSSYIRILSISVFLVFVINTYGLNYLVLINKDTLTKNISLYTAISFFIISLFIIPYLGVLGAIITVNGARIVIAFLLYLFYRRHRSIVD